MTIKTLNTYIQVDNLRQQRPDNKDEQDVEKPLRELGLAIDLSNDSSPKTLSRNDAQPANRAANAEVDEHALLAIARAHPQRSNERPDDDHTPVGEKSRRHDKVLHFLDIGDGRLLRGIHGDDHRPDDTRETADLAHEAEPLLQKDSRQNRRDHHRERAQRRHQDRIDKGVRNEIADFADDHQCHAGPPPHVLQVPVSFARFLIILDIGLQQTDFLQHKGDTDEQARCDGQRDTDRLVDGRPAAGAGRGSRAGEDSRRMRQRGIGIHRRSLQRDDGPDWPAVAEDGVVRRRDSATT